MKNFKKLANELYGEVQIIKDNEWSNLIVFWDVEEFKRVEKEVQELYNNWIEEEQDIFYQLIEDRISERVWFLI